jgi:DNA-binding transcriptional LysR family regulator
LGALRTLGVLLRERSVIRAATLLNVTPQAVSQTLARLREVFDDPLLVRAATGYEPTARAVALRPMLETTLTAMRRILQSDEADPRSFRGTVNLGVAKYAIGARFERALPRLLREAPGIAFRMHHLPAAGLEQVETGEVDVAISLAKSKSANVYRALLERGRWLCVMRRDHPLACASGLDAYLSAQHLVILEAQDGYDAVDCGDAIRQHADDARD